MLAPDFYTPCRYLVSLAIFDLDNTLIAGDSDHSWGEFLVQKNLVDVADYRRQNDGFYQAYQDRTLDIHAYLRFALAPLTQRTLAELDVLHQEFMAAHIEPLMLPKAHALIQKHRDRGDQLLIITATNGFVTRPIAARLGIADILASEPEILAGRYTGNCVGTPCFQGGKITRLNEWLASRGESLADSYFYSDSINDLPLLEYVDHPVAVDPDEHLRQIAEARNWPVISLRK